MGRFGRPVTDGLVEFATRTFEPVSRVWLQADSYRGTTTRASSLNRYAYVEGAPEPFVDHLGFFRAAAAIQAQKLAALQAAFASAFEELKKVVGTQSRLTGTWTVTQMMASYNMFHASDDPIVREAMDQIAREAFYGVWDYKYQVKVSKHFEKLQAEAEAAVKRQQQLNEIYRQHEADMLEIQAEYDSLLFYHTVNQTATVLKDPSFATHMVLDVVGMIPVIGEPADVLNAIIYTAEGNYVDAGLSMAGAIPFVGWASSGARIVKNTYRAVDTAIHVADTATDIARLADNLPLSSVTPPTPSIATITPVLPTVKAPEIPVTMPKTPDVAPASDQVPTLVYRGGSDSPTNMTPRPGIDETGLSTFDNPAAAAPNGGKVQVIDTTRLNCTTACPDGPPAGHVSIVPADGGSIDAWAATRNTEVVSPYTEDILDAIIDEIRVPKP